MQASNPDFKIIFGLGNKGPKYQRTYHNVGFLFVDYLTRNVPNCAPLVKKNAGFMNEAGITLKKLVKKESLAPESILIVHDDYDITLGNYKLAFGRGSAGHKGVASVMNTLGTTSFWRLRIGIRAKNNHEKAEHWVLNRIPKESYILLEHTFQELLQILKF